MSLNLSGMYSKLHPYKDFISMGMRVWYPTCGWYTVLGNNGVCMSVREENTGEIWALEFKNLQRHWELSDKDREFIEAAHPDLCALIYLRNGCGIGDRL